ncbi:hypothetical protein [Proteus mirabilis]|uniref:hypothetical protein n=1 Tax=Proteus mirabilis TaxID=584 RepID=UPI0034D51F3A
MSKQTPKEQKQLRKQVAAFGGLQWEHDWANTIGPHLDNLFRDNLTNKVHREYKGKERFPVNFGIDLSVDMANRRFVLVEWKTFTKVTDIREAVESGEAEVQTFFISFNALQAQARKATEMKQKLDARWCCVPEVPVVETKPGAADWLKELRADLTSYMVKAKEIYMNKVSELSKEYGELNDQNLYVGVNFGYDTDTRKLVYVLQTQGPLDAIKGVPYKQDHRDLDMGDLELPTHERDVNGINAPAILADLVAEEGGWIRISRPSKDCYDNNAKELVDILMERATVTCDKAIEIAAEHGITGEPKVVFDSSTGRLDIYYHNDGQPHKDLDESGRLNMGRNVGNLLDVITRVEPDLWVVTLPQFNSVFTDKYGDNIPPKYTFVKVESIKEDTPARGLTKVHTPIDESPLVNGEVIH